MTKDEVAEAEIVMQALERGDLRWVASPEVVELSRIRLQETLCKRCGVAANPAYQPAVDRAYCLRCVNTAIEILEVLDER
mgnify:CR=1 FL=1